jgi:hypothetical protein
VNIDPTLFEAPITPEERSTFLGRFYPQGVSANMNIIYATAATATLCVIALIGVGFVEWLASSRVLILFALIASLSLGFTFVGKELVFRTRLKISIKAYRFATAYGFSYIPEIANPDHQGFIFTVQNVKDRVILNSIKDASGSQFEIGTFQYVQGSGKNQVERKIGFMRIELDRNLPHMVLDTTADDTKFFGIRQSNLGMSFTKDQAMRLEGNFNDYFTLYAPKEYETDALYVFTPDLMARLIDNAGSFNAEIVDSSLYIYSTNDMPLDQPETYEKLFGIYNTVGFKALKQTGNYRDSRSEVRGEVANQGRRLSRRTAITIGTAVVIVFVIYALPVVVASIEELLTEVF